MQNLTPRFGDSQGLNGAAALVAQPGAPGPEVSTRLSNLDRNGCLVKRGVYVSWGGIRYFVRRVRNGYAYGIGINFAGQPTDAPLQTLKCESVQVVG